VASPGLACEESGGVFDPATGACVPRQGGGAFNNGEIAIFEEGAPPEKQKSIWPLILALGAAGAVVFVVARKEN
jgi:hypothetical protein